MGKPRRFSPEFKASVVRKKSLSVANIRGVHSALEIPVSRIA